MNDNKKNLEQQLEDVTFDDSVDRGHEDLLEQKLLLNFNAVGSRRDSKWRIIMNKKMAKLAAAAVILIGVFVGYEMFKGTSSVSWAQVRERVAAVRAVVYKAEATGTVRGEPFEMRFEAIQADDYGTRVDLYIGDEMICRRFALANEYSYVSLYAQTKAYMKVELTEENRRQNGDPKAMVEAFLQGDYRELGRSEINGVAVEGVESHDVSPSAGLPGGELIGATGSGEFPGEVVGRLWVDVATGWPVQVTLDIKMDEEQATFVVSDFQWEAQVDPEMFASVIPEDYKFMYTVNVGRLESGEQLADGLRYFAELSGGKYPVKLTVADILGEVGDLVETRSGDSSFQLDDGQIVNLKFGANHFDQFDAAGLEPAYYGETVTAADVDKVLLRWKLPDGQYRVIFGDLRIEDVSAGRLAELEAE